MIVETPIQDLSMDDIATEAGISRGLLFHYFPTKTDFYLACIAAAGRRILRTTAPDPDLPGEAQVEMATRLMIEQIERRRDLRLGANIALPERPTGAREQEQRRFALLRHRVRIGAAREQQAHDFDIAIPRGA